MKKILFIFCIMTSSIAFCNESLEQGSFEGKSTGWLKKDCSLEIKLIEKISPRFGKYTEYDIIAKKSSDVFNFTTSLDSIETAIEVGELGTSNGSDTTGQILEVVLDASGSSLSYKVIDYFTIFGISKKKTVINCESLKK